MQAHLILHMKTNDELDLHGKTVPEALELFVRIYNAKVSRGDRFPFHVIHGYGSGGNGGEIRKRLRKFLEAYPQQVRFERGEQMLGNPGITIILPEKILPTQIEELAMEVLEYCRNGKSEEKIIGKFRRFGQIEVKIQLKELERQGKITCYLKGKYKYYATAN